MCKVAVRYFCCCRDLDVNFRHNLIEVKPDSHEAVFELLDSPGETATFKVNQLLIICFTIITFIYRCL